MSNSTTEILNPNSRFLNEWDNLLNSMLQTPNHYGISTLSEIGLVRVEKDELESLGDVKVISDTRILAPVSEELAPKAYELTEDAAILTVIKSMGYGLDYGNYSNNILEFDSIARRVPKDNIARLEEKRYAKDWQDVSDEYILKAAKDNFKLAPEDIKVVVNADYVSMLYTDSPLSGKFLLGKLSPDNVKVYYTAERVERPTKPGQGTMFSIVLSVVISIKHPEDIYVLQAPFRFKE